MVKVLSSTIGYPRIGGKREWKRALESFWNGAISEEELLKTTETLRLDNLAEAKRISALILFRLEIFHYMTMC